MEETKSSMAVTDLRCEYLINPLGIDMRHPRLSWKLGGTGRQEHQLAYQILVSAALEELEQDTGKKWDSGKAAPLKR